jgi:hypothetical protein
MTYEGDVTPLLHLELQTPQSPAAESEEECSDASLPCVPPQRLQPCRTAGSARSAALAAASLRWAREGLALAGLAPPETRSAAAAAGEARRAVREMPDAGQHDPVGMPDTVRIVGQDDIEPDLMMVRRCFKRALDGTDIARTVVDNGKAGHCAWA